MLARANSEASIAISTLTTKGNQLVDEIKLPHGDNVSDGIGLGKAPAGNKPAVSLASKSDKRYNNVLLYV
jgi:hypothetical protein